MSEKVVIIGDPGIDTSFAIAAALSAPEIDLVGVLATAGNVSADRATRNVYALVGLIDPPKWPRVGAALPVEYDADGETLHGPDGLGGLSLPEVTPHQLTPADKLLVELADQFAGELTVLVCGPPTVLATALDTEPALAERLKRVVCVGGAWRETGNATPAAEFHFYCDPTAARRVIRADLPVTVVPLDVTRQLVVSPGDLMNLPGSSRTCRLLRRMAPAGIRASSHLYGLEGFHLKDAVGVAAVARPGSVRTAPFYLDVEPAGELTRGALVVDDRPTAAPAANARLATELAGDVHGWLMGVLAHAV